MMFFIFRLRVARILMVRSHCSPKFAWDISGGMRDMFDDGYKPNEAVTEEFSYWLDGNV